MSATLDFNQLAVDLALADENTTKNIFPALFKSISMFNNRQFHEIFYLIAHNGGPANIKLFVKTLRELGHLESLPSQMQQNTDPTSCLEWSNRMVLNSGAQYRDREHNALTVAMRRRAPECDAKKLAEIFHLLMESSETIHKSFLNCDAYKEDTFNLALKSDDFQAMDALLDCGFNINKACLNMPGYLPQALEFGTFRTATYLLDKTKPLEPQYFVPTLLGQPYADADWPVRVETVTANEFLAFMRKLFEVTSHIPLFLSNRPRFSHILTSAYRDSTLDRMCLSEEERSSLKDTVLALISSRIRSELSQHYFIPRCDLLETIGAFPKGPISLIYEYMIPTYDQGAWDSLAASDIFWFTDDPECAELETQCWRDASKYALQSTTPPALTSTTPPAPPPLPMTFTSAAGALTLSATSASSAASWSASSASYLPTATAAPGVNSPIEASVGVPSFEVRKIARRHSI